MRMRRAMAGKRRTLVVKEHEQLYLVRKAANGMSGETSGFRHHRPKEKRSEEPLKALDPKDGLTGFADNKRGAINREKFDQALGQAQRIRRWMTATRGFAFDVEPRRFRAVFGYAACRN
jgi:hypothetical protein